MPPFFFRIGPAREKPPSSRPAAALGPRPHIPPQLPQDLQRHDEVLDALVALSRFGEERCIVRENGNHAYTDFDQELPAAFDFLLSRIDANVR